MHPAAETERQQTMDTLKSGFWVKGSKEEDYCKLEWREVAGNKKSGSVET